MVEFVRDVVIIVTLLVALVAVALTPIAETDPPRRADQHSVRAINGPGSAASRADAIVTPAPGPQASARQD